MIRTRWPLAIVTLLVLTASFVFPAAASAPDESTTSDYEFSFTGFFAQLDPRVRSLRRELSDLRDLEAILPNPRIEWRQSSANVKATLLSAKPGESTEAPFIEFQFDQPYRIDDLYLASAPAFFKLLGERQRFDANRSVRGHFEIEFVAGGKKRRIAISDPNSDHQLPLRLAIDADEVTSLRLRFGPLSNPDLRAYLSISEIFILSGELNIAPLAKVRISDSLQAEEGWEPKYATDERHWLGPPVIHREVACFGYRSEDLATDDEAWVELSFSEPVAADEIRIYPTSSPERAGSSGYLFPRQLRVEGWTETEGEAHNLLDWSLEEGDELCGNILTAKNLGAERWSKLRVTGVELSSEDNTYLMALGEIEVIAKNENVAPKAELRTSSEFSDSDWKLGGLTDGEIGTGKIIPLADWLNGVNRIAKVQQDR
ncbi:MAG: hypothetical protein AAF585_11530, partial [Verrucomicrobiota bacterium]